MFDLTKQSPPAVEPVVYRPLAPEAAREENGRLPFAPVGAMARPFIVTAASSPYVGALNCLTATIYYEAATEPVQGQRAVAQVVLNRVRHPAFPSTVCGVVYQGSNRTTGCQFSFTCDGSLRRTPQPRLWAIAAQVAREALAGRVEPSVGYATHYHADYVAPYWAPSLNKVAQLGRHIFYRWRGGWGTALAFRQGYGGLETDLRSSILANSATTPADPLAYDAAALAPEPVTDVQPPLPPRDRHTLAEDTKAGSLREPLRKQGTIVADERPVQLNEELERKRSIVADR